MNITDYNSVYHFNFSKTFSVDYLRISVANGKEMNWMG